MWGVMFKSGRAVPAVLLLAFWLVGFLRDNHPHEDSQTLGGRIVVSAPVLLGLFAGDRYLAANFEAKRLAATGIVAGVGDLEYLVRAHSVVSALNPCHEDNYYLANALLSWGGGVDVGQQILLRATSCRSWDEWPPFFYGFNAYFFDRDTDAAVDYLMEASRRASENSAGFKKMAIMLRFDQFEDETVALGFLKGERDAATDPRLKRMLDKRVRRINGLMLLRGAQKRYEKLFSKSLKDERDLIRSGVLSEFPVDPLGLGYEFKAGRFVLKKMKVAGVGGGG